MSQARAANMATIANSLQNSTVSQQPTVPLKQSSNQQGSVSAPHAAPGTQKQSTAQQRQAARDAQRAQTEATRRAYQQQQQQLQAVSAINTVTNRTLSNIGQIGKTTGAEIENIPTPGSLLFPFLALAILFLIMIPINGHTRLVWLWLAFTGNAHINSGGVSSGETTSPPTNTPTMGETNAGTNTNTNSLVVTTPNFLTSATYSEMMQGWNNS